jgi:4-carboxymuconolactone decarboxylase
MPISEITSREQLPENERPVWDEITASRGSVRGPFRMLLHSPVLAGRVAHLGTYLRFESRLDPHVRELAALSTARTLDCEYEGHAHEALFREQGAPESTLQALREKRFADLPPDDRWVAEFAQQVLVNHRVDSATRAEAERRLGPAGTVELTAMIGYYAMLAATLNTFELKPGS